MYIRNKTVYLLVGFKTMMIMNTDDTLASMSASMVVGRVSDVLLTSNNKYVEYQRMRKMINKQIDISLIALALVVVSLFTSMNVYAV
jgi:hypothetical protein